MKTLDELYATRSPLPWDCPAMPFPPMGYDRWHYVGKAFHSSEPLNRPWAYAYPWDRSWEIDYQGTTDAPSGSTSLHYLVAVRDNEARRSLARVYAVARKLAHTLSPIDAEVWQALDDAESVLGIANNEDS